MNKNNTKDSMRIEVKNFGPIVKANIDLRPLTVFVGPSNTGKSYLAILVYALHRFFSGDTGFIRTRYPRYFHPSFLSYGQDLSKLSVDNLIKIAHQLASSEKKPVINLAPHVAELMSSCFGQLGEYISDEIGRCFGIKEKKVFIRKGQLKPPDIRLYPKMAAGSQFGEHKLTFGKKSRFQVEIPNQTPIPVLLQDFDEEFGFQKRMLLSAARRLSEKNLRDKEDKKDYLKHEFFSQICIMLLPTLFGILNSQAFYLPADRTGVMHSHNVVVSALISSATAAGLRPSVQTPMLTGVLADFLEQLIDIEQRKSRLKQGSGRIAESIEKDVLGGLIEITRSSATAYPTFRYQPDGWKSNLLLSNASSMVSEIAPLVLYIRHIVRPGNILIVEEPESHLHPGMQVRLIRQLAALVKLGVRVVITTHSEWLLEELSNIVMRSSLPKSKLNESVGGKTSLLPEQVGVWLFETKLRPKGSFVKEIPIGETGFDADYEKVAVALHNQYAEISSQLNGEE